MPPSTAALTIGSAAVSSRTHGRSLSFPKLIMPRHTLDTLRPVLPRFTYLIVTSSLSPSRRHGDPIVVAEQRELPTREAIVNNLVVLCVALGAMFISVSANPAEAQQPPTPEQMQSWATTLPRQSTSLLDPVYSPIDAIHILDRNYALMLQDFGQNSPGDAWTKAGEGSKSVDHFRRALVNSPD